MRHDGAEFPTRKPEVQMKCRRLDRERWRPARIEIECDRMSGGGANGGCHSGKACQCGAVHMPSGDKPRSSIPPHDFGKVAGIAEVL